MINYQNKTFRLISSSTGAEADSATVFHYVQQGNILTGEYGGGGVVRGHLIATVDEAGHLNMRYHHINTRGEIMTGTCNSTPEILPSGKIRLHEKWKWTCGDYSEGESIVEEV